MRLVTFQPAGQVQNRPDAWRIGLCPPGAAGEVFDLQKALAWWPATQGLPSPADPLAWYDTDRPWFGAAQRFNDAVHSDPWIQTMLREHATVLPRQSVRLGSPVPRPGKIICVGLNYRDHATEANLPVPEAPILFAKFGTAVIGTDDEIVLPEGSRRVDYEGELAVVIGSYARNVSPERALAFVLGYMNGNDVSERDFQKHDGQWVRAKSCDTFAPLGPTLVTADEVVNPADLTIRTRVNDRTVQDSTTRELIFDVAHLVAFASMTATLEPGDVILTGTPAGVGFARRPAIFLADGDVVEVEVQGLGVLRNRVRGS